MTPKLTRTLLVLAVLAAVGTFFALDGAQWLNLQRLQASRDWLLGQWAAHPGRTLAVYAGVYVVVVALALPGAAILTLAGGAIFGFGWGLLIVSFVSTAAATLAMLVARHVLRGWVQARFGARLQGVDAGLAKDGAFYLISLRLVPLIPFFVLNTVMGLTHIRVRTYWWASQLGMLLPTAVFVNAGTQLAQVQQVGDVFSPALLVAFALLALVPLLTLGLVRWVQRRRVYAPWRARRPRRFDRNLVVIGAGSGGLVTAYIAAAVKAKVTLVEAREMGGDCLNTGCVPSKALIASAKAAQAVRKAHQFGINVGGGTGEPQVDFAAVMRRVQQVVAQVAPHDSVERYTELGVEVLKGHATLLSPWEVAVSSTAADGSRSTQRLTTRSIVLATGASPTVPPIPGLGFGLDQVPYLTSDTLWAVLAERPSAPARLLVLGGGPIGCELAQAFARLGSQVTLVEGAERLLNREDEDVSALVAERLQAEGVQLRLGWAAVRARPGTPHALTLRRGSEELDQAFDELIIAVGRSARLTGYGLEELGIPASRVVQTNEYLETLYPNIYAVGDVAGPYQLTHAASHMAWFAAVNALFGQFKRFKVDWRVLPAVTFVDPEVARVGLNEREAQAQGVAYELTRYDLDDLDRGIADSAVVDGAEADRTGQGFVKVLTVPGRDTILGVTIVGERAGDWLAEYVTAMKHGLGLNRVLGTIHAYPTYAEANKFAAGNWKRAHAPQGVLRWVARFHAWRRGAGR
jgi:pyruvate/2-oxoglutarate dehydrogenase complex dihydrolipoamide dehydrogenase (E3) component/uncharacterized membrane protein YdjX (TVP38/TMEM64 family)